MGSSRLDLVLSRLQNVKPSGNGATARCPAHDDHENSLSINFGDDGRVLLNCFAGCPVEKIVGAINLTMADLFEPRPPNAAITIADLAADKGVPEEFLRSLGLTNRNDGVVVPYKLQDGSIAPRRRLRTALRAKDGSLWLFGKGKPVPYGLDRLHDARTAGFLILVEGESDCWTLWHQGFPALGIPGATMVGKLELGYLSEILRVYVVSEPGQSGVTFTRQVARRLRQMGWAGEAVVVSCGESKDPNELHKTNPEAFKAVFQSILDAATPLYTDIDESAVAEDPEPSDDPIRESGLEVLPLNPSARRVEEVLRKLAELLENEDELHRVAVRDAAIAKLRTCGLNAPAKLVDAAIGPGARNDEPRAGQELFLEDPEPWPETVEGSALLEAIVAVLGRFVVLADGAAVAIALWIVHTYVIAVLDISPYLGIHSPLKRCGKTTLLDVLHASVPRAVPAANITAAALFRTIEAYDPTLLIDEADTFLANHEELRGVLNAGHKRRLAKVIRTVGDDHEPRVFSTWCAKAIAMIGRLPDTLEDRSILIQMRRKKPGEKVERLRGDRIDIELEPIRRRCARWAADHLAEIRSADPAVPEHLNDRAADNWRPLLAIADIVGGDWPELGRRAAVAISGSRADDESVLRVQLLSDIRIVVTEGVDDELTSAKLVEALNKMDDRPWGEISKGKPLSTNALARLLRAFEIKPKTIRVGDRTAKGYSRDDFEDAFSRYLAQQPEQPEQARNDDEFRASANRNSTPSVTVADVEEKPRNDDVVTAVTDAEPVSPEDTVVAAPVVASDAADEREEFEP